MLYSSALLNMDRCTHSITSCFQCPFVARQPTNHSSTKATRHENMHANAHPSISTTSPVQKKVNVTVHIRFVHPSTRALEFSIPLASITRAFLLPTRDKTRSHWTVVLPPTDVPDKSKAAPPSAQQIIFGLDALTTAPFETTSYSSDTPPHPRRPPPSPKARRPHPRSANSCPTFPSHSSNRLPPSFAAVIEAYLSAKSGTLWFFDTGILWGGGKPCEFWAVSDLLPKDGVRLIRATGRSCSVILSRKRAGGDDDEVVGTAFSMVSLFRREHRYVKRVFYQDEGDQATEVASNVDQHGGESKFYMGRALYRNSQLRTSTHTTDPVCVGLTYSQFTKRLPASFVHKRDASNHMFDGPVERYGLPIIPDANSFLVLPNSISRSMAVGAILHPGGPAQSLRSLQRVGGSLSGRGRWVVMGW